MTTVRHAALLSLFAFTAGAAPRQFSFVYDSEVTSEGNIELESWLDYGHPANTRHYTEGQQNLIWWLGGRIGWIQGLELSGFLSVEQKDRLAQDPDEPDATKKARESGLFNLMAAVLDVKYRPFEPGTLVVDPYIQFQYLLWADTFAPQPLHPHQFHLTVGASKRIGRFYATTQLGYWDSTEVNLGEGFKRWIWFDTGVAASYAVLEGEGRFPAFAAGVELWSILSLGRPEDGSNPFGVIPNGEHVHSHQIHNGGIVFGPSLSVTRGRFWSSLHVAFRLVRPVPDRETVSTARLIVGVAL